jgi:hypothetical protein
VNFSHIPKFVILGCDKSPPLPLENQPKGPSPPHPEKQPKGTHLQENPSKGPPSTEQQRTPAGFILNKDAISAMWRSFKPFKQDVQVHEPSKDNTEAVGKFLGGLQKFKHKEPLVDLSTSGMTVQEFWQHDDRDYTLFEYGKPLVPRQVYAKLSSPMKKIHEWYYLACIYGLNFIKAHIPGDIFKTSDFELNVKLYELHTIYYPRMLNITMMTAFCM